MALQALILIIAALISAGYSAVLERIHDLYTPDYTWLTVVVGNGLVIVVGSILVVLWNGDWAAVWWFVGANVACGLPVIVWQLWQNTQRRKQRQGR